MQERLITVAQAQAIDQDAQQRLGMPTLLLMENAARGVAEVARAMAQQFVLVCGPGNNGGDGLAAMRHLGLSRCTAHLLCEPDPLRAPDAALQLRIMRAAGATIAVGDPSVANMPQGACYVDALFGTGLTRPLHGSAAQWVAWLNRAPGPRLAVDLPSGLHGDTGAVLGVAVRADATVTFVAKKQGMVRGAGPEHCGRVVVAGLGLP